MKKNSKIEVQLKDKNEKMKILEEKNQQLFAYHARFDENKVIYF